MNIKYDKMNWVLNNKGYYIGRSKNNGNRGVLLHRYIWEQTYGKIPEGYHIHHIDEDRSNNNIENLKLISISEHSKLHSIGRIPLMLGRKHSEETKLKMSILAKGRKHSEETKDKIAKYRLGKKHSKETRLKMSINKK